MRDARSALAFLEGLVACPAFLYTSEWSRALVGGVVSDTKPT